MMKTSCEATINRPLALIDLPEWLANLSDRDYQACSPAHRAGGTFREHGTLGSVNVESIGGHLLIQHYLAAESSPHHLVMYSRDTRVYVMHLFPATIAVTWTLAVEPASGSSVRLRCSVETRIPMPLSLIARLALLGMKEEAVQGTGFRSLAIFRPGIIAGNAHTPNYAAWLGRLLPGPFGAIEQDDIGRAFVAEFVSDPAPPEVVYRDNAAMRRMSRAVLSRSE